MKIVILISFFLIGLYVMPIAETLTLEQALDIALNQTARGSMIRGNLEVAEQNYFARRINFYLPEISINGSVPAYTVDESYRFFGGASSKSLYRTEDISYNSFIQLDQSLITGGELTVTANLLSDNYKYPYRDSVLNLILSEDTRQGYFTFSYTQPLLKPSDSKYNLKNSRDDYSIAQLTYIEEETELKKNVIEAYLGLLQAIVQSEKSKAGFNMARLKGDVDSLKFSDGVISQEDWLISESEALDAELIMFEAETELEEKERELSILLELDIKNRINPVEPNDMVRNDMDQYANLMSNWESSVPALKSEFEYNKAKREADYKSAGHGLTGDLNASYNTGQGKVESVFGSEDINTKGWNVSLKFSLPLWDGGASGAEVKSARLKAEQSRYEFNQAKREARSSIVNLANEIGVSYRRLDIMKRQIDLAQNRIDIAETRKADGQISEIEYLEVKITYLESKDKYLEELSQYLLNRADLSGKFK